VNRLVISFLLGLVAIAAAALLVGDLLIGEGEPGEFPGAAAGIIAAALSAVASFFPVRAALGASNIRFMRIFFTGLLIRALMLAAVALVVRYRLDWSLRHYLIAVGLSYPLYVMLEGWVLSRELPVRRAPENGTDS